MKILIDQNISYRIVSKIAPLFGDVIHVKDVGLMDSNDYDIFKYARNETFDAIVTIDEDFVKLLDILSAPPKIVWIRTGNCSTDFLSNLLISKCNRIEEFLKSKEHTLYEIFKN